MDGEDGRLTPDLTAEDYKSQQELVADYDRKLVLDTGYGIDRCYQGMLTELGNGDLKSAAMYWEKLTPVHFLYDKEKIFAKFVMAQELLERKKEKEG